MVALAVEEMTARYAAWFVSGQMSASTSQVTGIAVQVNNGFSNFETKVSSR